MGFQTTGTVLSDHTQEKKSSNEKLDIVDTRTWVLQSTASTPTPATTAGEIWSFVPKHTRHGATWHSSNTRLTDAKRLTGVTWGVQRHTNTSRTAHINTVHSPRINGTLARPHYLQGPHTTRHESCPGSYWTRNCSHLYRRLERIQEARQLQQKVSSFSQVATLRQETQIVIQDGVEC